MTDVAGSQQLASSGAFWAYLSFLTRARASPESLQPDTLARARQQRRLAKASDSRPCADPGLSPTSLLAVTAERSVKDPNGRALSHQCRRPRITRRRFAIPAALHRGVLLLPLPGILHHGFSARRFGASACLTPLARSFIGTPRGRTPAGFEGGSCRLP